MTFRRMVVLVLLGMQASGLVNVASAALPDDYVNIEDEIPVDALALTPEQQIERLIQDFNAALATITPDASSATRLSGYRRSMVLFDRIRLDRASFDFKPGLTTFLANYVDELNVAAKQISGAERTRNRGETRAVLLRIASPRIRVEKLLDVARIEADFKNDSESLTTLRSAAVDIAQLIPAERDAALLAAVRIVARPGRDVPADAFYRLSDISAPALRADAIRLIAEASAARDPKLVVLMASTVIGADRDTRLLDISDFMTRKGDPAAATWTAVLASPKVEKERDAALAIVIDDALIVPRSEFHAVHAIKDAALRDRKLLDIVRYHLDAELLAEARIDIGYMQPGPERVDAWLTVGRWLFERSIDRQAADAAQKAEAVLAALKLPRSDLRDRLSGELAALQALLGQELQARQYIGQIARSAFADPARVALVQRAINDERLDDALAGTNDLARGPEHDEAALITIKALANDKRWDDARSLLNGLSAPLAKLEARVVITRALKQPSELKITDLAQPDAAALFGEIEPMAAAIIKDGAERSEAYALRAIAHAAGGRFPMARADLLQATTAERYNSAIDFVVGRHTLAEGIEAGLATARLASTYIKRQRGVSAVAIAAAERGEIEAGAKLVRAFDNDPARVETFRKMAAAAAGKLDQFGLINARQRSTSSSLVPTETKKLQLLSASDGRQLFAMPNPELGRSLPAIPALRELVPSAISISTPPIAPGAIHVLPMEYSDFNQKFLASLSYAFNDYGGRLFYFDAQKTAYPVFISLDEGVFDLPAIARYLETTGQSRYLVREGRRYTLSLPLLISPKATLVIGGTDVEELRLTRDSGSYLVNAGRLIVDSTRIVGWDAGRNKPADLDYKTRGNFRPFIVNWSGSVGDFARSTITHLGFLGAKGYGISYTSGPETLLKSVAANLRPPSGRLYDNSFQHMLYGLYAYEAESVLAVGNEYRDNIVYGLDPHDRSKALLMAYNTAYGTGVKHGIIVSREVDNSWIVGNLSFGNAGSGIMLDRSSTGNLVYANSSFANENDGVALFESSCNIVAANQVMRNKRDGIKARNSWDVGIFSNQLFDNGGIAVNGYVADLRAESLGHVRDFELDPYFKISDVAIVDNLIKGNVGGVSLKGTAGFIWRANQVVAQPRPYTGLTKALVNDLYRRSDRGLYVRTDCPQKPAGYQCPFKINGFLTGTSQYDTTAVPEGTACSAQTPPKLASAGTPTTESAR